MPTGLGCLLEWCVLSHTICACGTYVCAHHTMLLAHNNKLLGVGRSHTTDTEGIRTLAGKAQLISSPTPQPVGHNILLASIVLMANVCGPSCGLCGGRVCQVAPASIVAAIAQLGKRHTKELKVPGSIPGLGIICSRKLLFCVNDMPTTRTWETNPRTPAI